MTSTLHESLRTFFYHISLKSSYNDKRFRRFCRQNQDTHFMFKNFFPESCRLRDNVEIYVR